LRSLTRRGVTRVYRLLREPDPPHRIALGAALGIFVGLLPLLGIQMAVVAVIALPLRGNLKAAIAGVWLSNPVTVVPLYYAHYRFGLLLLPARETDRASFASAIESASQWDWGDIGGSLWRLFDFGADILQPMWLGSAISAAVFGIATYFLAYRAVVKTRERWARLRAAREARRARRDAS